MANFGPLAAVIGSGVCSTLANFSGFASWQHYAQHSSSRHEPNLAALNRGRHLYLAGRPSRRTLAHILVLICATAAKCRTKKNVWQFVS